MNTEKKSIPPDVYEKFVEKSANLVFTLSENGKIVKANAFATAQLGQDLQGRSFKSILVNFHNQFDLEAIKENPGKSYPLNIKKPDGLPQTYHFMFEFTAGNIIAFGQFDHGELDEVQKQIIYLNEELSNLARELHKKNAQLHRLNQEKNQFLGMAAHDLRKPIGLVIAYAEFLMDEAGHLLDDEQERFLDTIHRSSMFMKRLVDDFLDVSAIEAGKFELDLQPADMRNILDQSLQLNEIQAVKKGIALQVEKAAHLPRMCMDASKIEQVITNLVSNAIEHAHPKTSVIIHLQANEKRITFSVKDQGPGIPPEEMDRLFKPFEKTSTKKIGGEKSTGLGMIITRKIIEAHCGSIWVKSLLDQGTTVYFTLPLKKE